MKIKLTWGNGKPNEVEWDSMLDAMSGSAIFEIVRPGDGNIHINECCDGAYGVIVTKEQLLALSDEIRDIATGKTLAPEK